MIVLETVLSHVTHNRDFAMTEARVTLFAKTRTGQPPHRISVRTEVVLVFRPAFCRNKL